MLNVAPIKCKVVCILTELTKSVGRDSLIGLQALDNICVASQASQESDAPNPALCLLQVWCDVIQEQQAAPATADHVGSTSSM